MVTNPSSDGMQPRDGQKNREAFGRRDRERGCGLGSVQAETGSSRQTGYRIKDDCAVSEGILREWGM